MVLPLVVLDVHAKVAKNPDYTVTLEDVQAWEAKHGRIPPYAFVAMPRIGPSAGLIKMQCKIAMRPAWRITRVGASRC